MQTAKMALSLLALAGAMFAAVFYFSQQREEPLRLVGSGDGWSDAAEKKPEPAAEPQPETGTVVDYDPGMVVGGQTLYEDSAAKAVSPEEIIGSLPKGSTEAARLGVPLYSPRDRSYAIPEAGLSNPPVVAQQMAGAGRQAEQDGRMADFAAYASDVDVPKMELLQPGVPQRRRPVAQPEAPVSRQDKQDLNAALSDQTEASHSLASGFLSSKSVEGSRGRHELNSRKSGSVFDGSESVDGRVKAVFDLSSFGEAERLVVSPAGSAEAGAVAAGCAAARASDGKQMMLLGDEMGRLARLLNSAGAPGCCDYFAQARWNESLRTLEQQCAAFNNAGQRLAVACKTDYFPADCAAFPAPVKRAEAASCLMLLSAGLALLAGGALLPMLGAAYVVLGGGLAGGALLGGVPGLLLCAFAAVGALLLHGSSERSRI